MIEAAVDHNFTLYDGVAPILDGVLQRREAALESGKTRTIELILLLSLTGLAWNLCRIEPERIRYQA